MCVVRFAPSPTGNLHIGGARTAIFNYLFARKNNGKFLLRIEDTDIERSKKEYEDEIIKSMAWLGMDYDGKLLYQSKRTDVYKTYIKKLLDTGNAYYCTCSKEELDKEREIAMKEKRKPKYSGKCRDKGLKEGVIRFKTPLDGSTIIDDKILGKIEIQNKELDDFIIARTDGSPTYNFTVVVDDYEMKVSHIIRGDDHVNNTPKQILIYKALDLNLPIFAHVPMILGPDKKKLSKRHGSTAVSSYRKEGYLPEALFNYLVRLGWSHGDDEIFTKEDLIKIFDIEHIGKAPSVISFEKLNWLNAHYLKTKTHLDMVDLLFKEGFLNEETKERAIQDDMKKLFPIVQERAKKLSDVFNGVKFLLFKDLEINISAKEKYLKESIRPAINDLIKEFETKNDLNDHLFLEEVFKSIIKKHEIKMKDLAQAVRVLLTGTDVSPGIFDILAVMKKDLVLKRLKAF
jgi:glutamyl-tRNA synthetase